ncbi:unnamed protein product [Amaranthus hypochondriacus]
MQKDKYEPYELPRPNICKHSSFNDKTVDRHSNYPTQERHSRAYTRYGSLRANSECTGSSYQSDIPRENSRTGGARANSAYFDRSNPIQVDNSKYEVDDTRITGRTATQMFTTADIRPKRISPNHQQTSDASISTVYHVKKILGENFHALRAANQPKFANERCIRAIASAQEEGNNHKESHMYGDVGVPYRKGHMQDISNQSRLSHRRTVSAYTQNTATSTTHTSFRKTELNSKSGSAGTIPAFAYFSSPPETSLKASQETSICAEPSGKENTSKAPKNTLESLLFELSTPDEMTPSDQSGISSNENTTLGAISNDLSARHHKPASLAKATTSSNVPQSIPAKCIDTDTPKVGTSLTLPDLLGDDSFPVTKEAGGLQYPNAQQLGQSICLVANNSSAALQSNYLHEDTNNQGTTQSPASQTPLALEYSTGTTPTQPSFGASSKTSFVGGQPSREDAKVDGRKELPTDLFVSPYGLASMPYSGWQIGPGYGIGFQTMQYYPPQMQIPSFSNVAKSTNPFDTSDYPAQPNVSMYASKGFLQGGMTNLCTPLGSPQTPSFGAHLPSPQSTGAPAYPASAYNQIPYASAGSHVMQHPFRNLPPTSTQGTSGFGGQVGSTAPLHSTQPILNRYPAHTNQSSFPMGRGNPFG